MSSSITTKGLEPLLKKYDVYGPRYTSYPTALQFNESFTVQDYQRHAQDSNQLLVPKPLSLYIHIPFCHSLCYYCGCNKVVTHKPEAASGYLEQLFQEIELQGKHFADDRLVQQIHFGGGTPTYLSSAQLREIMEVIAQSFHLGLPDKLELGIEIDPRSVTPQGVEDLLDLGFNRISIGVQDFDPAVQEAINRIQSYESIDHIMSAARAKNVRSISLDVIYGLPKQTRESFDATLDQVIALRPDRIALYNYAHMPQRIPSQRLIHCEDLPNADQKMQIFLDSIERLTQAGYVYIGMDHFALPEDSLARALEDGSLQRNFQGYSTNADCDIVGLGVSAISRVNDSYSQNVGKISQYRALVAKGQLPIAKGVSLTRDDQIRAGLIQTIMCSGEVRYSDFNERYDIFFHQYFKTELSHLTSLADDGFLEVDEQRLCVTSKGRLFLRNIAMTFDAYFAQTNLQNTDQPRYSKTL